MSKICRYVFITATVLIGESLFAFAGFAQNLTEKSAYAEDVQQQFQHDNSQSQAKFNQKFPLPVLPQTAAPQAPPSQTSTSNDSSDNNSGIPDYTISGKNPYAAQKNPYAPPPSSSQNNNSASQTSQPSAETPPKNSNNINIFTPPGGQNGGGANNTAQPAVNPYR